METSQQGSGWGVDGNISTKTGQLTINLWGRGKYLNT